MVQQLNPFFFLFIHMSNDTTIGYADKIKDMVDFLAHGYLLGNLDDSIFEAEIGRIDKAVGIGDVTEDAVGRLEVLEDNSVDTVVCSWVATDNDVGRHVALHTATALHERATANAHTLLDDGTATLDGAVVEFAVACHTHTDTDHAVVVNMHVVADVYLVHEVVVVANGGGLVGISATCDYYVLADVVVVADDYARGIACFVVEILRRGTDDRVLVNEVAAAHGRTAEDTGMCLDGTIVANDHTVLDVGKGFYSDVSTQFGFGVYVG